MNIKPFHANGVNLSDATSFAYNAVGVTTANDPDKMNLAFNKPLL